MTDLAVLQLVSLCALIALSLVLAWMHTKERPASRPAGDPIAQPPASTPATVEHTRPADAGAWRLEAMLEADREMCRADHRRAEEVTQ